MKRSALIAATAALIAGTTAQNCISLSGSTTCSAFNASSISTNSALVGLYPFLRYVSNVREFDQQLSTYVSQGYVQEKYVYLFGCSNINLSNTTNYYARYTKSFLCNGIVQNSRQTCGLTEENARPLCAAACAELARSEETIISSSQLCSPRNANYADQLRADFTNCALPADSLAGQCIPAVQNEPNNCGFSDNLVGLCNYCRASTVNATDSCCFTSNAQGRCQGVTLPVFSSIADVFSTSTARPTSSPSGGAAASAGSGSGGNHLSGGAIAGIVIGSVLGLILICALIIFACILARRRRQQRAAGSFLNQPSPQRKGMTATGYPPPPSSSQQGYEVLPGGRVARMAALSGDDNGNQRDYDPYGDSPGSGEKIAGVIDGIKTERSPGSDSNNESSNEYSSPEAVASGQSEQLPFFKDYYSNDDIHPGDKVSVLWAYQPRAGDEFELERGDMLKVIGIWDDGWATGVRINERAEDYEGKHKLQRDSGVSNGTGNREESPPPPGEIKAFPLVCVCLPEAWKKTIEGDTSTEGSGPPNV